jgi:flagellar motility protein MotE (MotC chaperone)
LSERREQLDKREQDLATREAVLKAGESRIDTKVAQLQDLEKNIKGLLSQYDKQKQAEIEQLVRIYSAMKPLEAAKIFNSLDMSILKDVIQSMKEAKAAPIIAVMDTKKAQLLTEELSQRKQFGTGG